MLHIIRVLLHQGLKAGMGAEGLPDGVDLPVEDGGFETTILSLNVLGALSRKLFANALVQYDNDSQTVQANIRVDWVHTPGSDLFLVLNTGYFQSDLVGPRDERWVNRAGVVGLTYLKAF